MVYLNRKYNPSFFDMEKINAINSAFIKYTYIGEDKYEMVESEKVKSTNDDVIKFFKNGERISKSDFYEKTKKRFFVEKNRVVFLHDDSVCYLDLYIKKDYQIVPVVSVEFGTEKEMENFKPLEWFGVEVSEKFYNEFNLWKSLQVVS